MTTSAREPEVMVRDTASGLMVRQQPGNDRLPVVHTDESGNISPSQLIMAAIDRGIPAESLEKLVALQERMEAREAAKAFITAMAAFKAELPTIVHSKKADFKTKGGFSVKYSYTELDELARAIDPYLTKHGFSYSWDQRNDKGMVTTTCIVQHIGGHSRSSSFTVPAESDSAASPQQKIGIADTYAGRRALIAVLGLTTADKDPRPAEIDPTPISDDQVVVLEDLLKVRLDGKTKEKADAFRARFLAHMDVDALEKIPAVAYDRAVTALQPPPKAGAQ